MISLQRLWKDVEGCDSRLRVLFLRLSAGTEEKRTKHDSTARNFSKISFRNRQFAKQNF